VQVSDAEGRVRNSTLLASGRWCGGKPGVAGHTTVQATIDSSEGYALQAQHAVTSDNIAKETRFVYPQFLRTQTAFCSKVEPRDSIGGQLIFSWSSSAANP